MLKSNPLSKSEKFIYHQLTATAYVDIWLIFGQLVPFSEVILLTAMEYIREGDGSGEDEITVAAEEKDQDDTADNKGVEEGKQMRQMCWLKVTGNY